MAGSSGETLGGNVEGGVREWSAWLGLGRCKTSVRWRSVSSHDWAPWPCNRSQLGGSSEEPLW